MNKISRVGKCGIAFRAHNFNSARNYASLENDLEVILLDLF
jgi:hypothetical protein